MVRLSVRRCVAVAVVALALLASCGGDDEPDSNATVVGVVFAWVGKKWVDRAEHFRQNYEDRRRKRRP